MSNGIYLYYDTEKNYVAYVGKDSHIDKKARHKAHMRGSQQFDSILQDNPDRYEYRVYCEGNFSNEELNNLEIQTIKLFDTFHREDAFNFTEGGDGVSSGENHPLYGKKGKNHPAYGAKRSEETRRKISEANSGENHPFYGTKRPEETRRKISEALSGTKHPEETRRKISEALSGEKNPMYGRTGEKNPMYGTKRSEETRRKISEALKGTKRSEETRKKMSEAKKGKYCGENNPMYGRTGKNSPHWKNDARVVKAGFNSNGKQNYALIHNGKIIKRSIYKEKLEKLAEEKNKEEK